MVVAPARVPLVTFRPCWWLAHRHVQTLLPALLPVPVPPPVRWEVWETPDGDVVDLAWLGEEHRRTVIVLHGLDGSINSHYTGPLLRALVALGWRTVLLQARGSSGHVNRLPRSYHSGDTVDVAALAARLAPEGPLAAVGISIGGNQLLKWLGETGAANPLVAAVAVGVPYDLAACDAALSRGFARIYQRHLVRGLVSAYRAKAHLLGVDPGEWRRLRTFRLLDARLTAPLNGFASVEDYYAQASCRPWVRHITVRTHLVHAEDDPFVPAHSLPVDLPPSVTLERHPHGGHIGFVAGPWRPRRWLEGHLAAALTRIVDCPPAIPPRWPSP